MIATAKLGKPVEQPETDNLPSAVIYTHSLLEGSNTFIKSHAEALSKYRAVYAGAHRVKGIDLPPDRTYVLNDRTILGLAREAAFRKFGWARGLANNLRPYRPAVVHAHFGSSGPAAMSIAKALQIPFVVTFHGADATVTLDNRRLSHREREFIAKRDAMTESASAFIAVSQHIKKCLVEQGYPEKKILLHRNGIDTDYFRPDRNCQRENIIVFVGRFVEKKGAEYLIEAGSILHQAGVEFKIVMIGAGPLEESLRQQVQFAGIPCLFTGFLPISEVKQWLNKATVVAVPSVTAKDGDSEGLPTILLEAQSMETPVVATWHSGIPEGVLLGVTGDLVDERDSSALADKLRSFLDAGQKVDKFGRAGRQFVADRFDLKLQARGLEKIYDHVICEFSGNSQNIQR